MNIQLQIIAMLEQDTDQFDNRAQMSGSYLCDECGRPLRSKQLFAVIAEKIKLAQLLSNGAETPGGLGLRRFIEDLNLPPLGGSGPILVVAGCLRKFANSLVFTGNRAVHLLQLYADKHGRSWLISMGK